MTAKTLRFTKMHGIGNDYVYVDLFEERVGEPAALAKAISDRHFGVGADGLILIGPSEVADVRMRIFNADGSEAEMCGNGIRCAAKYTREHGRAESQLPRITIETRVVAPAPEQSLKEALAHLDAHHIITPRDATLSANVGALVDISDAGVVCRHTCRSRRPELNTASEDAITSP